MQTPVQFNRTRQPGFTLVELMVVVGLIALVVTQGIPWLQTTTLNSKRTGQINEFVSYLNAARGLAINGDDVTLATHGITPCTNCRVSLCKSSDGQTCTLPANVHWDIGWIMFWDADGDGRVDAVDNDRLIRVRRSLEGDVSLRGNNNVRRRVTFDVNGFTGNNGTLIWCDSRGFGSDARAIVISTVGRTRTAAANDASITETSCSP